MRQAGGQALLLPRIQPIGEVEADELLLDGAIDLALPPAISALRRQLLLARLLSAVDWPLRSTRCALPASWRLLLDELQTERVALASARPAGAGRAGRALAGEPRGAGGDRRRLARGAGRGRRARPGRAPPPPADRLAAHWRREPPAQRIVAAGSTGSIPATRALLQVIAGLPRGTVVLPGLDRELDEASWRELDAGHPQYGLKQLLDGARGRACGRSRDWPAPGLAGTDPARARCCCREVMRPSGDDRRLARAGAAAAGGDSRACISRSIPICRPRRWRWRCACARALEQPGRTAALVTPDRHLARRVAVELRRWGIEVDDSAGTPLDQTPPGAFLLLTARLIVDGVEPVDPARDPEASARAAAA